MSSNPTSPATDFTDTGENALSSPIPVMDEPLEVDLYGLSDPRSLSQDEEEEDGEDLFGENLEADYRPMPALDVYDAEEMDDEDYDELSIGDRRAAEKEMDRRDGYRGFQVGFDHLLYSESEDGDSPRRSKRRKAEDAAFSTNLEEEEIEDLQDTRGHSLKEWVLLPETRQEIASRFRNFLRTTVNANGHQVFRERMRRLCENNDASLVVDYPMLVQAKNDLAYLLPEVPFEILPIFDEVAKGLVMELFPKYARVTKDIRVRIAELPLIEDIRTFRKTHLNQLIRTTGVVSATTGILPQLSIVKYDCGNCGNILGPYPQTQKTEVGPGTCSACQSNGPFIINMEETIYRNYQKIIIQEPHNKIPGGRIPRSKPCILLDELCDRAKVGDEIDITGIYTHNYDGSLNTEMGFPVFSTVIIANYIVVRDTKQIIQSLTDDDIDSILKLSKDPKIVDKIVASIAPSIYGYDYIKRSLAMSLFGGESKNPGGRHKVRGDINVLICGDPGTAKSQFLKNMEQIAPRAIFTTGKGASAVGLTAYVKRNTFTKEWTLEAGALVLADQGVCLIDEFDKMSDKDRTSIHEAMEQQTISISKAGIVTSLQARCSVVAAANPIGGIYESYLPFASNVNLSEPILSRFDVLCVVRDEANLIEDQKLADFVCRSHLRSHPRAKITKDAVEEPGSKPQIPHDLLKKYIVYAKQYIHPTLRQMDQSKVSKLYSHLRQEALATGSMPVTARHIESLIRMAEAHARMHLREVVLEDDVNVAIRILLESFVETQKFSVMKAMRKAFHKYLSFGKDTDEILYYFLTELTSHHLGLARSKGNSDVVVVRVPEKDLILRAHSIGVHDLKDFYGSPIFKENNFVYHSRDAVIVQTVPSV